MVRRYWGGKSCCWVRSIHPPEQSGPWHGNEPGRRSTPHITRQNRGRYFFDNETSSEGKNILVLPNLYAVRKQQRKGPAKRTQKRDIAQRRHPIPDPSPINSLPTELLVKILEHLVPTDHIFHFGPTSCTTEDGPSAVSVHQVCGSGDWQPGSDISRLALTCQRMRDVSYGLWYGRNQFIVELATVALTSEVQLGVEVPTMVDVEDREHPLSWSRICAKGSLSAPYPSSSFTMRYISDLTICINLSSSNSSQAEHLELSQQLRSLVTCFGDDASNLRRLAVSLDVCKKRYKLFKSQRLELCGDPPRMMLRETVPTDHVNITPRQSAYLEKLVQPLFQLRGVGDMTVRWLLAEEFAATLIESATRPPESDTGREISPRKRARRAKC